MGEEEGDKAEMRVMSEIGTRRLADTAWLAGRDHKRDQPHLIHAVRLTLETTRRSRVSQRSDCSLGLFPSSSLALTPP